MKDWGGEVEEGVVVLIIPGAADVSVVGVLDAVVEEVGEGVWMSIL